MLKWSHRCNEQKYYLMKNCIYQFLTFPKIFDIDWKSTVFKIFKSLYYALQIFLKWLITKIFCIFHHCVNEIFLDLYHNLYHFPVTASNKSSSLLYSVFNDFKSLYYTLQTSLSYSKYWWIKNSMFYVSVPMKCFVVCIIFFSFLPLILPYFCSFAYF